MEVDVPQVAEPNHSTHMHESLVDFMFRGMDCKTKSSAMCVCKQWNNLAGQPVYWEVVDLSEAHVQLSLTAIDLVRLLKRSRGSVKVVDTSRDNSAWQAQEEHRFKLGVKLQESLPYTKGLRALALAALLPQLRRLVLDERASCIGGMTDDFARALAFNSPNLEHLEVHFERYSLQSESFTDAGMIALAEGCKHLNHLTLHNCMYVTDRSLYALAAHCDKLQHFSVGGYSERISDYGLTILFESCPHLLSVQLCSKLYKVTDEAIAVLARHSPELEAIKLTQSITNAGLQHLATGCHKLHQLVLKSNRHVTAAALVQLVLQCPELHTLVLPWRFELLPQQLSKVGVHCVDLRPVSHQQLLQVMVSRS